MPSDKVVLISGISAGPGGGVAGGAGDSAAVDVSSAAAYGTIGGGVAASAGVASALAASAAVVASPASSARFPEQHSHQYHAAGAARAAEAQTNRATTVNRTYSEVGE